MNAEDVRLYCLSMKGVEESLPFGPETVVFKVMGKMFCLVSLDGAELRCNVKCDPEQAEHLRASHTGVLPGYHMNKRHWNTLVCDGSFTTADLMQWIADSYDLVAASLTGPLRMQLETMP